MDSKNIENAANNWHEKAVAVTLKTLQTSVEGLSENEAIERIKIHGYNRLPVAPGRNPLIRFLLHFHNILIYVLLGAAAITMLLGHVVDTIAIVAVVFANAAIGYVQEGKAEKAMDAIRQMLAVRASVIRDAKRNGIAGE